MVVAVVVVAVVVVGGRGRGGGGDGDDDIDGDGGDDDGGGVFRKEKMGLRFHVFSGWTFSSNRVPVILFPSFCFSLFRPTIFHSTSLPRHHLSLDVITRPYSPRETFGISTPDIAAPADENFHGRYLLID